MRSFPGPDLASPKRASRGRAISGNKAAPAPGETRTGRMRLDGAGKLKPRAGPIAAALNSRHALEDLRIGSFEATAAGLAVTQGTGRQKKFTPSGSKNHVPAAHAAGPLKSPAGSA